MAVSMWMIPIGLGALMIALPGLTMIAMWRSRSRKQIRIWHFVTRGLLLIALFAMLLLVLPKYKAMFLGFGTELPGLTVICLQISDLTIVHFGAFTLAVTLAVMGESTVFELSLRKNETDDDLFFPKLCSTLVTGVWSMLMAFSAIGVLMPTIKLLNDLA